MGQAGKWQKSVGGPRLHTHWHLGSSQVPRLPSWGRAGVFVRWKGAVKQQDVLRKSGMCMYNLYTILNCWDFLSLEFSSIFV